MKNRKNCGKSWDKKDQRRQDNLPLLELSRRAKDTNITKILITRLNMLFIPTLPVKAEFAAMLRMLS